VLAPSPCPSEELSFSSGTAATEAPFPAAELAVVVAPPPAAPEPVLWDARTGTAHRHHAWETVSSDQVALAGFLRDGAVFGFSLLCGVPCEAGAVAVVAELFGAVRQTNYGRIFDVRVSVDATNLADTSLPLSSHTDNPYRRPTPTLQLLHCLATGLEGGETVLVDGFAAVERLAASERVKVDVLANTPIRFAYQDAYAELAADVSVITLTGDGKPIAIHVNNRSKGAPGGSAEQVAAWYDAYLALLAVIDNPAQQVVLRLEPGDLILIDNERVLHGRTGFVGAGMRHLQGCYADRDGLLSTLAVLQR